MIDWINSDKFDSNTIKQYDGDREMGILGRFNVCDLIDWVGNHRILILLGIPLSALIVIIIINSTLFGNPLPDSANHFIVFLISYFLLIVVFGKIVDSECDKKIHEENQVQKNRQLEALAKFEADNLRWRQYQADIDRTMKQSSTNYNNESQSRQRRAFESNDWVSMTGERFETMLLLMFQEMGFHAEHTGKPYDHGSDLTLHKGGRVIVVQAKGWERNLSNSEINEALGACKYYHANEAWVVTNSFFTKHAMEHARGCNTRGPKVILYDQNAIRRYLDTGEWFPSHQ